MPGQEVSASDLKRRLSAEQRPQVDAALKAGMGTALYADERGRATVFVTFGSRQADFPGLPPGLWGGGELHSYVPPQHEARPMVSPLKAALEDPERVPQIKAPPRGPSMTSYPEVLISGRNSSHPRGNSEYLNLRPSSRESAQPAEVLPPQPQEPAHLTDDVAWWQEKLAGR
jgi:hypothetical protein